MRPAGDVLVIVLSQQQGLRLSSVALALHPQHQECVLSCHQLALAIAIVTHKYIQLASLPRLGSVEVPRSCHLSTF
jgi:hypothetical protein